MSRWRRGLWLVLCWTTACRGPAPGTDDERLARLIDSLTPAVERVAGLRFTHRPLAAVRTHEQVRAYIRHTLDAELPTEKARGIQAAYRLLGLLPDSLELRPLLLDLFTEQIVGYYEPDSATLFVVANAAPEQLRLVLAHELVHALQDQHVPLDSILRNGGDNDRQSAAQALFEGQATLAGLEVVVPDQSLFAMPEFWETYRDQIEKQQSAMPVFSKAPRILRESLIFPYLAGADFVRWWAGSELHDTVPFGPRLPVSTEQILHPYRYGRGDQPIELRFTSSALHPMYEDVFGEFELRVLTADLGGAVVPIGAPAMGWGGDRYRIYETPKGPAMVWYLVWDDPPSRGRFLTGTASRLEKRRRLGYRLEVTSEEIGRRPGNRIVIAPQGWEGWARIPGAALARPE